MINVFNALSHLVDLRSSFNSSGRLSRGLGSPLRLQPPHLGEMRNTGYLSKATLLRVTIPLLISLQRCNSGHCGVFHLRFKVKR
jgi:hypothetical protein